MMSQCGVRETRLWPWGGGGGGHLTTPSYLDQPKPVVHNPISIGNHKFEQY